MQYILKIKIKTKIHDIKTIKPLSKGKIWPSACMAHPFASPSASPAAVHSQSPQGENRQEFHSAAYQLVTLS